MKLSDFYNVLIGEKLKLVFRKSNKLIDDNFMYIKRYGNSSELMEDYEKLVSKFDDCFYRNSNSALDICEGNLVSKQKTLEIVKL